MSDFAAGEIGGYAVLALQGLRPRRGRRRAGAVRAALSVARTRRLGVARPTGGEDG